MKPTLRIETKLWRIGFAYLAGLDEVGRGSLAGPVVACAVIFPQSIRAVLSNHAGNVLSEVNDSKLLSPRKRAILSPLIKKYALDFAYGSASHAEVDRFGIVKATQMAMRKAIKHLRKVDFLLIDAFHVPYIPGLPRKKQLAIVKGDQHSFTIASASILAKVYRDRLMIKFSSHFPEYGLAQNKGYGTLLHRRRLRQFGPTKIHRKTFIHLKSLWYG